MFKCLYITKLDDILIILWHHEAKLKNFDILYRRYINYDNVDQFYCFRATTLERNKNAERSIGGMARRRCAIAIQNAVSIVPRKESSRCQAVCYRESVTLDMDGHRRIMIPIAMA